MSQDQLAELSRLLYSPVTLLLYVSAAIVCLYSLTTRAGLATTRSGAPAGAKLQRLGIALAWTAVAAHVAHEIVRGLAQDRLPLGNMFEFTSAMALTGALAGLIYLTIVRKKPELVGFVMLGAAVVVSSAMLTYADPGPLMPILDTWWRTFHVSVIVTAAGIFTVGFLFNGLHLLRDTAERGLAAARAVPTGRSTVGAAHIKDLAPGVPGDDLDSGARNPDEALSGRVAPDEDHGSTSLPVEAERRAMRTAISPLKLAVGTFLGTSTVSWVFVATPTTTLSEGLTRALTVNLTLVAVALIARWFVPFLPQASTLDGLAYRTIALGFFAWTFGVIAGAMWAEQSWGRFWGWDPKETASFLTWIAYAAYLHARATRGTRGRGAAWIGIGAFAVLMFTYYAVNLVFVGLHSYAGLS
ncbi:cytochrome c biogenesis protein CcsA [Egicoccus sp. AB-alg2]|uniref:cytochrome c biogenesis protein CcsA n=1 Tax=Egicoccus sp. AB-alg2 TaxID=3242693 RepID=UPI00359E8750